MFKVYLRSMPGYPWDSHTDHNFFIGTQSQSRGLKMIPRLHFEHDNSTFDQSPPVTFSNYFGKTPWWEKNVFGRGNKDLDHGSDGFTVCRIRFLPHLILVLTDEHQRLGCFLFFFLWGNEDECLL